MRDRTTHIVGLILVAATSACVTACAQTASEEPGATEIQGLHIAADSDLLAPPSSETYYIRNTETSVTVSHGSSPLVTVPSSTDGVIVISDGIMSSAEFSAQIGDRQRVEFALTEPVLFERQGRTAETIMAVGTLKIENATYTGVHVLLEPEVSGTTVHLGATFEIPDSLTSNADTSVGPYEITMTFDLESGTQASRGRSTSSTQAEVQ